MSYSIKYNGIDLSYDEVENKISINGKEDKHDLFSPSFVDNGEGKDPTFIGFVDNKSGKFISLSGKEFKTIKPDEIKL